MSLKQISVFVENKPGKMQHLTQVLADHKVDMRALSLAETSDFGIVRIIVDRVNHTDTLDVQVEMTPEMFTDNMGEIKKRQSQLEAGLRAMLGISAKVVLVAPKSIVRSEGKAVRVIDKRKI